MWACDELDWHESRIQRTQSRAHWTQGTETDWRLSSILSSVESLVKLLNSLRLTFSPKNIGDSFCEDEIRHKWRNDRQRAHTWWTSLILWRRKAAALQLHKTTIRLWSGKPIPKHPHHKYVEPLSLFWPKEFHSWVPGWLGWVRGRLLVFAQVVISCVVGSNPESGSALGGTLLEDSLPLLPHPRSYSLSL